MTTRGKAKESARTTRDKIKEAVGRTTGDRHMAAEGHGEQMSAKIKHAAEKSATTIKHGGKAAKGKAKELIGSATGNKHMKADGRAEKSSARTAEKFNK